MKKILMSVLLAGTTMQAADILELVQILDRNDTSTFTSAIQTIDDANTMRSDNNKTILMYASWIGNIDSVKHLVSKGADVNALDSGSASALHLAIWKGHDEIALYLLENGASTLSMSLDGMTPLDIAIMRENRLLIDAINKSAPKLKPLL